MYCRGKDKNSRIFHFCGIERVGYMKVGDDGPLINNLHVVILEVGRDLSSNSRNVKVKK